MPKGVKPSPNFHGKKGRSGRGTIADEQLKKRVVYKAWDKKDKRMSDGDATQIVLKDMTNKTELTGDLIVQISETIAKKRNINVASSGPKSSSE